MEKKYDIYKNDLLFKNENNINNDSIMNISNNLISHYNDDTYSINYRIKNSYDENCELIELSHMNSNCLTELLYHSKINDIKEKLLHIFARKSMLVIIPNMNIFTNLKTLDLSNNNINIIPELPITLEELIINDNNITKFDNYLPKLKRLDCQNNKIKHISVNSNIEYLILNNNPIKQINNNLHSLHHLEIINTNIECIYPFKNLKFLNCSNCKNITVISNMNSLDILVCNYSSVSEINELNKIRTIEMINTNVNALKYFSNLVRLIFHENDTFKLSSQYKIDHYKKNKLGTIDVILQ